ncbi:uncharacterized protein LOC114536227 [Dendronephthya gigantea]|uniref:uncharacterized protein LOC114536227 n=1 Tax=Dendronephthya gigantea TaxID=151771 RepID=UPI00106D7FE2|nr:uncharacterized protein LOC114536227 [Dendronephthya gigantea]
MTESKEDDNVMMSQIENRDVTSSFAQKMDNIVSSENKQSQSAANKQKEVQEEFQEKGIQNEKYDDGIEKKKETSRSVNVCKEGKQKFWDEIKKQVECGENKEDHWKKTILWRAFQFSPVDPKIFKYLVDHGADVYSNNEDGETVFSIATRNGLFDLVKYFVQYGPEHNFRDDSKVLQSAIQSRHEC